MQYNANRLLNKSNSFRVLEERKSSKKVKEKLAVYEFTFDPSEEPPPNKKKKKTQTVRKKATVLRKPKAKRRNVPTIIDVTQEQENSVQLQTIQETSKPESTTQSKPGPGSQNLVPVHNTPHVTPNSLLEHETAAENHSLHHTVADIHDPPPDDDHIDYSPVINEESRRPMVKMSAVNDTRDQLRITRARSLFRPELQNQDPLNLVNELSFDVPIASSSMNTSQIHPEASPWRAEFESLPFKWAVHSYVKPNGTPAVETSFVNFTENKKKHVYTNLVPEEAEETLPDIVTTEEGVKLKQTSIAEFIREVAEKQKKKKRKVLNAINGPSRANLPRNVLKLAASSEVVNKMFDNLKTAIEAPEIPDKENVDPTDVVYKDVSLEGGIEQNTEGSNSVHLFEDVDIVHHLKPTRKSYSKPKKVTFCQEQTTTTNADNSFEAEENEDDQSFKLPSRVKATRKPAKKKQQKLSKKEEAEVEAWAAAFNSMCEDVDEFPLVLE